METFKPNNNNESMRRFTYRDNSDGGREIFDCTAVGIIEADKMYEEKFGVKPEKQNHVGCVIERIDDVE